MTTLTFTNWMTETIALRHHNSQSSPTGFLIIIYIFPAAALFLTYAWIFIIRLKSQISFISSDEHAKNINSVLDRYVLLFMQGAVR